MKRLIPIFLMLCLLLVLPVQAATYRISQTDMTITLDDTQWYVFTRDNIKDNPELEELGITYDYMHGVLYDNSAYMDACLFYEDGSYVELFVRKAPIEDSFVSNLSNRSDKDAEDFAKALAEKLNVDEYSVYANEYKFARVEYVDPNMGLHLCEYVTIVNQETYTLTFQATAEFDDEQRAQIKTIVDSIRFDVDMTLEEKEPTSFWGGVFGKTVIGAGVGACVGGIVAWVGKAKKKKQQEEAMKFNMQIPVAPEQNDIDDPQ